MTEQEAIEQLSNYKRLQARLHLLSNYSVGAGITVSRLNEDDQLQELHRRLRGLPSYMYLSEREQRLETVAHTYLVGKYPAGLPSQQRAVQSVGYDDEDTKLLKELKEKIAKVMDARGYADRDNLDQVLERLAEYQDIQAELKRIDDVLVALESYDFESAKMLRLVYLEGKNIEEVKASENISSRTYFRRLRNATAEYKTLAL
jgi:cell fate (sporulation/competence/biofilm development) regulator YlbF (YheA/YmcA/DUF963 family)